MPESETRRNFLQKLFGIGAATAVASVATRAGATPVSAEIQRGGIIDANSRKEVPFNVEEVRIIQAMFMEYINPDADPEFARYIQGLDRLPSEVLNKAFKKEKMPVADWDNYNSQTMKEPGYIISPDVIQYTVYGLNTDKAFVTLSVATEKIRGTDERMNQQGLEINPDTEGKFHALDDLLFLDVNEQRDAASAVFKDPPTNWKTSFGIVYERSFGTVIYSVISQGDKEISYGMSPVGGGVTVNLNPDILQQSTNN